MDLIVNNYRVEAPITEILQQLKIETGGRYLSHISDDGYGDITITCPFHKDGQETHPSCHVFGKMDDPNIYYGTVHCFTCGVKAPLYHLVAHCFEEDDEFGKKWLADKFGATYIEETPVISINLKEIKNEKDVFNIITADRTVDTIPESVLDSMSNYHPYMVKRKLTEEVVNKFKVRYDNKTNCIVFPIWDEFGNLVSLTRRSVGTKRFNLESNKNKPIYLLNFLIKDHITTAMVVESQINALTGWTYGIPSIALLGTGSSRQYDILAKSGVRRFLLAFDGDEAGRKGRDRFINYFKDKSGFSISYLTLPEGKDVNDLSREEFDALPKTFVR